MLSDGKGEIKKQPLKDLEANGEAFRYEFEVASNFLNSSQFVLHDLGKVSDDPNADDSFWFFLKDFKPKSMAPSR